MKTRSYLVGVALMALSLVGAMTTYSWSFGHGGHWVGHGGVGFPFQVLRALDLTAAQQAQIQDIQSKHQATLKTIFSGLRSANEGVTDNLLASREVTAKQKKSITDLQAQLLEEQLAVGAAVRDVLTPDQLTKAAEIMAKQKALRAQWKSTWENDQ